MRLSHCVALSGLALSVAAVDIRAFASVRDCQGGDVWSCININPNTCCARLATSFAFAAIPREWNLDCRTYTGSERCFGRESVQRSNGRTDVCVNIESFDSMTGAGYGFVGKKVRGVGSAAESSSDNRCVRPDHLELEDGSQYRLDTLTEEQYAEITEILVARTNATTLPTYLETNRLN